MGTILRVHVGVSMGANERVEKEGVEYLSALGDSLKAKENWPHVRYIHRHNVFTHPCFLPNHLSLGWAKIIP